MRPNQSRLHSLAESFFAALLAGPTAMLLHKVSLIIADEHVLNHNQDPYIVITWIMFFLHSIGWKYLIRRINEKYHISMEPRYVWNAIRSRMTSLR